MDDFRFFLVFLIWALACLQVIAGIVVLEESVMLWMDGSANARAVRKNIFYLGSVGGGGQGIFELDPIP